MFEFESAANDWPTDRMFAIFCILCADLLAVESAGKSKGRTRNSAESNMPMNPRTIPVTAMAPPLIFPFDLLIADVARNPQMTAGIPVMKVVQSDSIPQTSEAIARPEVFVCCGWYCWFDIMGSDFRGLD